jgi:Fe-S-cluster containining protein
MSRRWYAQGLRFTCTGCGNCCTGEPGFTWVSEREVASLADRLGLDEAAFRRRYTVQVHRNGSVLTSLVESAGGDCVFYRRGLGCTVYQDRPRQCRTWPFWRRIIASRAAWAAEAGGCPGMDHGDLHAASHIAATAADDGLP